MRRHTTLISWPRRDPRHYRFAIPNAVWEYQLRPAEFVIFSYLCYHSSTSEPTLKEIATGVHMTTDTMKKYLDSLRAKKLIGEDGTPVLKSKDKKFFTLPNEVFLLRLSPSAFVVYAYLLLIEDRRTHTCHPSYNTIAATTGLAKNTAMKSVSTLLEMGLIAVESSSYFDKCGMKWKGNNLYTILPVRAAVDALHRRQLRQLELDAERRRTLQKQKKYNNRHPRAAPCATAVAEATPWPIPTVQAAVRPLNASVQGAIRSRIKACRLVGVPLATSARSAGSFRGYGVTSFQREKRAFDLISGLALSAAELSPAPNTQFGGYYEQNRKYAQNDHPTVPSNGVPIRTGLPSGRQSKQKRVH